MKKALLISKNVVSCLLGALFIASAIMKLLSIDTFQMYILSFHIINFTLTELAARLLIGVELFLGLMLLLKLHHRWAWWGGTLLTSGFTLFLIYVVLFRNDTNCHCFGDFIEIDPLHSIYKNLVILALFVFTYHIGNHRFAFKKIVDENQKKHTRFTVTEEPHSSLFYKWTYAILILGSFVVSFVLFPPNAIYSKFISHNKKVSTPVFDKAYADSSFYLKFTNVQYDTKKDTITFTVDTARLNMDKGTYIVAVVSSGCKYCRQSCELMSGIFAHNHLNPSQFKILIWSMNNEMCSRFMRMTKTSDFEYHRIYPGLACDMVYGTFPTFLKVKDGKIVGIFDSRGISENAIKEFLEDK